MRIDRSEPADEPEDANIDHPSRSASDNPDVVGKDNKDSKNPATGDNDLKAALTRPGSPLRAKIFTDYKAGVDAVNRQYDIEHGGSRAEKLADGYKPSPALKGDPYHLESVEARSADSQELYAATSRDRATVLGYDTRIPSQKVPFDSHGQEVFTNGKSYITPDVDGHNVSNGWKMFSRGGVRIGTYDSDLNYVKE